jgi:hypothetical protein
VKANPLPLSVIEKPFQVVHSEHTITVQPFNLLSESRHNEALNEFQSREESMKEEQIKMKQFQAKPLPMSTFVEPAPILPSEDKRRDVLRPLNVVLESDVRAERRKQFDLALAEKAEQNEQEEKRLERERAEQENALCRELRRKSISEGGMCFKANPVRTSESFSSKLTPASTNSRFFAEPAMPTAYNKSKSRSISNQRLSSNSNVMRNALRNL